MRGTFAVIGERQAQKRPVVADFSRWTFRRRLRKSQFSTTQKSDFQVRAIFSAVGCGAFCERFQSGWRLSSRKRRCPKEFSGALWPFRRIMGTENVADASHGQRHKSCIFCATVVNEKDFLTVRKLHRCNQREYPRQRRNCAAIDKDKAARF